MNGANNMKLDVQSLVDKKFSHISGRYAGQANISLFAKAIGVERITALKIYNKETTGINFDILEAICRELECTPNDIIVSDDPTVSRLLMYVDKIKRAEQKDKEKDDSE